MSNRPAALTRREALKGLVVLPALAGFLASAAGVAEAKGSKSQFKYQTHPHGNQRCGGCRFFHAGRTPSASGTCDVVAGAISASGWCTAYAAK